MVMSPPSIEAPAFSVTVCWTTTMPSPPAVLWSAMVVPLTVTSFSVRVLVVVDRDRRDIDRGGAVDGGVGGDHDCCRRR